MVVKAQIQAMRPRHWIKSGFCLAALFFSDQANNIDSWRQITPLLFIFSMISSAGYLINDLLNINEDKKHPRKRFRPIASGAVTPHQALALIITLYIVSFSSCIYFYGIRGGTLYSILAYVIINISYSFILRKIVILDLFTISFGFVLRVTAGAFALSLLPSPWLMGLTYLLALLLSLGKRMGEVHNLNKSDMRIGSTRTVLTFYQGPLISLSLICISVLTLILYFIYCMKAQGGFPFTFTALPVGVALFSYIRIAERSSDVETPERLLTQQSILVGSFIIWALLLVFFLYIPNVKVS